ncbi:MAG: hypothetical protein J6C55_03245 [Oscillospiraceae bacterium]|nr:hypothetical protein [Oscillospiraceae bacterium]
MSDKFEEIQVLNNQDLEKTLACVDSFYINSAIVSVYNKPGAEFINIRDSVKKMYLDIYNKKIKIPEFVTDSWVSAVIARYIDQDIKIFKDSNKNSVELEDFKDKKILDKILDKILNSKVKINYEGLFVEFNLNNFDQDIIFDFKIISTLRGKLCSSFNLNGREINFSCIIAPARLLQRHEVLTLQIFLTAKINNKKISIILSKFGDKISKIYISDGEVCLNKDLKDFNINWGSFDINRGV